MNARLAALSIVIAAIAVPVAAQGLSGTVWGTVKDTDGHVVSGATVALVSETRGTRLVSVVTNADGRFVIPNITADVYTIRVDMPSFRALKRTGLRVGPGLRLALGTLTIGPGASTEEFVVRIETPPVQGDGGGKFFTIPRALLARLPLASRRYGALLGLVPGAQIPPGGSTALPESLVGGGASHFAFDGASGMDLGDSRAVTRVGVEAIQDVAVAVSAYQAEYGRSSGLQVTAVMRSGTNRFLGSVYDVERKSAWNANSKTNILNGDPKPSLNERDWGYSVGGPVGRPGGSNTLFFFVTQEFQPRTAGGDVVRFRFPTPLERQGDFSATTDNLGQLYRFIRDPTIGGACVQVNSASCFRADNVVGRIPASRLCAPGMAILNWYPLPNIENVPAGQAYNYEATTPAAKLLGYQSVVRVDYQPRRNIRGTFTSLQYEEPKAAIPGTLPGWNDARADNYGVWSPSAAVHWTMNARTFVEGVWGMTAHHRAGCPASASGPALCRSGLPVNPIANRVTAGFGALASVFPDATLVDRGTLAYQLIARAGTPVWDGTRVQAAPSFTWGGRVANSPPNNTGPFGDLLDTRTSTVNVSVTRVMGRHTAKAGYYFFKTDQLRGSGTFLGQISFQNDATNPLDTTFPFANAAIGVFTSYQQQSRWAEGTFTARNHEVYLQDAWRARHNLTVDVGLRFVHLVPEHDGNLNASNFFPDRWQAAQAPALFVAGCQNINTVTCAANQRRAWNPVTGLALAANTGFVVGTLVPANGSATNGLVMPGQGIAKAGREYPAVGVAPRAGVAWQIVGNPLLVVRGGGGLFFDRPVSSALYNVVNNPPSTRNVTVRFGQLQTLGTSGVTIEAAPAVTSVQYDQPLPASTEWHAGVQVAVPFHAMFDISYAGRHSYNTPIAVNLNSLDLGMAFQPQYADPTQLTRTPANSYVAVAPDLVRFFRGYSTITQLQSIGWRTSHAVQVGFTRGLRDGLSFGFYDTVQIYDNQRVPPRLQHSAGGTLTVRDDQQVAQELFQDNHPQDQIVQATFTWALPSLTRPGAIGRAIGLVVNDWSLAGVWNGQSGAAYGIGYAYQSGGGNVNLTGSPDYAARAVLVAAPGAGCSTDPRRQFDTSVYEGPAVGSVGLDSPDGYLRGCFQSSMDFSLARTIRLMHGRSIELRADVFNAFNQAAIANRNAIMQLPNPSFPGVILNLPFDENGAPIDARSVPRGAGFGAASDYQAPRSVQLQVRFVF